MSKFKFGDKVLVKTFNNAGKPGRYPFTVKESSLVLYGRRYEDMVVVFQNEHISLEGNRQLFFPENHCERA